VTRAITEANFRICPLTVIILRNKATKDLLF
jgi:hypothetical protein